MQWKNIKGILQVLGKLRDLDVQLMGLEEKLKKASTPGHQQNLVRLRRDLKQQRQCAYQQVVKLLQKKPRIKTFVEECTPGLINLDISRLLILN
ncbi:MAG: CHAD domain-containing protein [Acaryochloridaceae cyanobacterium RL_2_7]|nr:CHAD domain-containing protein [Acaryochloridaceae cyanobacterium RL_2_7]